ncbi:MAG: hypothetical protein ACLVFM_01250, partial [Blautia faecis]
SKRLSKFPIRVSMGTSNPAIACRSSFVNISFTSRIFKIKKVYQQNNIKTTLEVHFVLCYNHATHDLQQHISEQEKSPLSGNPQGNGL